MYYNFLKERKAVYNTQKQKVLEQIQAIYHEHGGIYGYRSMKVYLERKGIRKSDLTISSIYEQRTQADIGCPAQKTDYTKETVHKMFENLVHQEFYAPSINQKWCTDFSCLFLTDVSKRYNCSVIDLHDRSVVASIADKNITAGLAIRTLVKTMESQTAISGTLALHGDQGSWYTSKDFVEFCENAGIIQSMSKAGYPYHNASMERYYNTLKMNGLICIINAQMRTQYRHRRVCIFDLYHTLPYSYNEYETLFEARCAAEK